MRRASSAIAGHHRIFRIGEPIDHREVVAGQFAIARFCLALAPDVSHAAALSLEFAGFQIADRGIERAPLRHRPENRRNLTRRLVVELEILIYVGFGQRREIEHAGDRVAHRHQILRHFRPQLLPIGCHHGGSQMSAGRMAADQHAAVEALPQRRAGAPDLLDDVGDGDDRAQIVADHADREAALLSPRAIWLWKEGSIARQ